MRIVFCGTPASAVPSLEALAERGWEISAVVTQPDRPAGRGAALAPPPVKTAAESLGIPVLQPSRLPEIRGRLEEIRPDVVAVVAYGRIFRRWLLELPRLGCVNVHFSLLPRHRGVAPVQWAVIEGDRETGVTTMLMDRGVDTGDTLLSASTPIGPDETAGDLTGRLGEMGGPLLARTLEGLEEGTVGPRAQPEEGVTWARRLLKDDGRIDWRHSADAIARRVRGLSPWPGAHTTFRGKGLKIHRVRAVGGSAPPGRVVREEAAVLAGTAEGRIALEEVQPAGKGRMEGSAWARGARPEEADTLGDAG